MLVEAMACGTPVVATASAGTRDIVRDGIDGVLVERHDVDAVADALGRVLEDEPLRRRLGDAARTGAARFALSAVASDYERVLAEMLT